MNVYWHTMGALLAYNRSIAGIGALPSFWLGQNVRCHRRPGLLGLGACPLGWLAPPEGAERVPSSHVIKGYKPELLHSFECIFLHTSAPSIW